MKTLRSKTGPFIERPYFPDGVIENMCADELRAETVQRLTSVLKLAADDSVSARVDGQAPRHLRRACLAARRSPRFAPSSTRQ